MTDTLRGAGDSYDLTTETPINIDPLIKLLNYDELPMLGGTGGDGFPTIQKKPVDNTIFYWQTQDLPVPRTTVDGAHTDVVTTLDVATGTGISFSVGDAVKVGDEIFYISAVTADALTVTRGAAGTTNVALSGGEDVIGIGTFLNEGEIGAQAFRGRDKHSNYTQIWTSQIDMTRTQQRVPKYGVASELGNLVRQVALSEGQNREQSFLYGIKYQSDPKRMSGGLDYYITSNEDTTGAWLNVSSIEAQQQAAYDAGGMFDTILARPKVFGALNNMIGAERVRTTFNDEVRGRRRATHVTTEFGDVELFRNRHVRISDAFGVNRDDLCERVFQPMVMQPLAKTDDRDKWMFVCEAGFEVRGQEHMAKWTNLSTSGAFPADVT